MTVCVAGIACSATAIIAVSDRRITYGDIAADVASVEKSCAIHPGWVAMFSGNDIGNVTPIIDRVTLKLAPLVAASRVDVAREFRDAFRAHRRTLIEERVLASLDMSLQEFRTTGLDQLGTAAFDELRYAAKETKVDCEFLVCGFSGDDPQIFAINDTGLSYYERIGFWSVGAGAYSAISSLAFQKYHRGLSLQEALYRILEAKFMADTAVPTVGADTYTLVIERQGVMGRVSEDGVLQVRKIWEEEGQPRIPRDLDGRMPQATYSTALTGVSAVGSAGKITTPTEPPSNDS